MVRKTPKWENNKNGRTTKRGGRTTIRGGRTTKRGERRGKGERAELSRDK